MNDSDLLNMSSSTLVDVLKKDNSLVEKYDTLALWDKIQVIHWGRLLSTQPQFADKCDKWNSFSIIDWIEILSTQPQLINKFNRFYESWGILCAVLFVLF